MELSRFPRRKYTPHDTPIEPMKNLSKDLSSSNIQLWIKRDDLLGLTGGGNKTRKLEFTMVRFIYLFIVVVVVVAVVAAAA
jgi:D-cysteine desulfhydrase